MFRPGNPEWRKWLQVSAIVILVAGLVGAAMIYKASADYSRRVQAYESGGGEVLPSPDNSKQFLRDLQLYGGTANVLAYQLRTWFADLWRGKSLACMIALITILVSLAIFYAARRLPPRGRPDSRKADHRGEG